MPSSPSLQAWLDAIVNRYRKNPGALS